jgi:rod shape-determining protein MreD
MTLASSARAVVGFLLLVTLHFTLRPLLGGRVQVDFLTIAVLFAAVRLRPGVAACVGWVAGVALDAVAPGSFGATALGYTVVAFVASRVNAAFFTVDTARSGAIVLGGKWAVDAIILLVAGGPAGSGRLAHLLFWSPLAALLTAGVATLLLLAAGRWFAAPRMARPA